MRFYASRHVIFPKNHVECLEILYPTRFKCHDYKKMSITKKDFNWGKSGERRREIQIVQCKIAVTAV